MKDISTMLEANEQQFYNLKNLNILVVDDQVDVRNGLKRLINTLNCEVHTAASGEEALVMLQNQYYDIVFTDLKMHELSGVDLLNEINQKWPEIEVVLITGHGSIEIAVSCLQNGAAHFITKPFDNKEILSFIERAGYRILARQHSESDRERFKSRTIIAADSSMREIITMIDQVAPSKVPVLIEGASGTGKELIAREIHNRSLVKDKPFLAINCIALPDTLLESELFGYKRGAFTGAHQDSRGLFELVQGGTIFLDEIASMSPLFQGKLLRVLQEKTIRPLGSSETVSVDFRIISATNKNLDELVARNLFREDLLYRLQVIKIKLPSLNERKECIPALAEYFLERAYQELLPPSRSKPILTPSSIEALKNHDWRGNVRELENTIQRALIVSRGDKVLPKHFGFEEDSNYPTQLISETGSYEAEKQKVVAAFQRTYINKILAHTNGNISKAALQCGLSRAAFQRIMRKLEIRHNG